jgi:ParB-like chromosome segregation protein Spo0J
VPHFHLDIFEKMIKLDGMKKLTLHPACRLFPQLEKVELKELAADIKANGLQNPIVLYRGQILDGRNRFLACRIAGVKPRFVNWDGEGSPLEWVISENLIRRHLTSSQRAVIALDLLPLLEKEARERQRLSKGRGEKVDKKLATLSGKASAAAARIAKTNATYVAAVKYISKSAPELVEKIRAEDGSQRPKGATVNCGISAVEQNHPPITSIVTLPHDVFQSVKVHSEILLFNMPKLKPHYFLPDKYLR